MRASWLVFVITMLLGGLAGFGIAQTDKPGDQPKEEVGATEIGDGIIVPGERVGPLHLGMRIGQILRVMPSATKREVFPTENIILYEWRKEGVWVSLQQDTRTVRLISVFGTGTYKTNKGVALLHTESKMEAAYGKDYSRYEYPEDRLTLVRYVPIGLQFGIVNYPTQKAIHGRIFTIGIFMPGKEPPLTKPPSK